MNDDQRFKLNKAAHHYEDTRKRILQECGWTYRCDSPGSYWYWEKVVKERRWTALSIQDALALEEHM